MISVADISDMLADRCEALVRELLPSARKDGHYLKVGSVDGEEGASLVVHLAGARRGKWLDFAGSDHGDMLDLITATQRLLTKADAVRWAKDWLRREGAAIADDHWQGAPPRASAAELARRAEDARARAEGRGLAEAKERAAKIRGAKALFLHAGSVAIDGTPAAAYLKGRGLDAGALPALPGALRFNPDVWNSELREKIPAMLGAVYLADGTQVAVHRTYLRRVAAGRSRRNSDVAPSPASPGGLSRRQADAAGLTADGSYWTKADVALAKKVSGPSGGGFIPINKGASGKPMSAMAEGEPIYMAEGIEDAIAIRMLRPAARIVAGISVGNMGTIVFPARARQLVIVADRDDKVAAVDALERSIAQQQARGMSVSLVLPPPGVKDLNDWVLRDMRSGAAA